MPEQLQAITVYLPLAEIEALELEAEINGRSGVSAQIRWLLNQRRVEAGRKTPAKRTHQP